MTVDETNPVTPEADTVTPEAASLTRVSVKRRKISAADNPDGTTKTRKSADLEGPQARAKVVKRGRKAAIVFDESIPVSQSVTFDPPVAVANGAARLMAGEINATHAGAAGDPSLQAPVAAAMPPSPALDQRPAIAVPDVSEEPCGLAADPHMPAMDTSPATIATVTSTSFESSAPELSVPIVEFAELPMPVDANIELLPNPGMSVNAEPQGPEFAQAPEPAVDEAEPRGTSAHEPIAEPQLEIETASEADPVAPDAMEAPANTLADQATAVAVAVVEVKSDKPAAEPVAVDEATQKQPSSRFEAIARAARKSALSANNPGIARTIAADAARSAEMQKRSTEIFGYWVRAKNGRRFPSRADFEIAKVAEFWPNSMLLTCGDSVPPTGNHISFSKVMRLDNNSDGSGSEFNFTSMLIEWILTIGGEAARVGQPVQDTEVFPSTDGTHAYKIVALPLSDRQTQVDHVLCHLTRT
ncbi:MAG: hypothetical protein ACREEE_17875 [Dongiaceae bacterium]